MIIIIFYFQKYLYGKLLKLIKQILQEFRKRRGKSYNIVTINIKSFSKKWFSQCQKFDTIQLQSPLKSDCHKIIEIDNDFAKQNNIQNQVELMNFDLKLSIQQWSNLQDKYEQQIQIKQQSQIATLKFNNKEVILIHGNIVDQKCDAIINPLEQDIQINKIEQLTGVTKQISQFAGVKYQNHIKKINKKLQNGDLIIMPFPNHFQHIISISIKHYSPDNQNLEQFRILIQNIFKIAQSKQLQTITLPIFGGVSGGQFFSTVCNIIIQETLSQLSIQSLVQKVIFVESNFDRIQIMMQAINHMLYPPQLKRQILYQWQWQRNDMWLDYDEETNQQIDEAYQIYQKDKYQNQVLIIYPFTKLPGTHEIDFNQMILKDRSLGIQQNITFIHNQYYFEDQMVNGTLNDYLILQKSRNQMIFPIFNKDHKIIFNDKIVQINVITNFERQVRNIPYLIQQQINSNTSLANLSNFEFNQQVIKHEFKDENQVIIQISYSDNNKLEELRQTIKIDFDWKVLNFLPQDLNDIEYFIKLFSKKIELQMIFGNQVKIQCTCQQYCTINNYIENAKSKIIYPQTWIPQTQNCIKSELFHNEIEYKMVNDLFQQTLPSQKIIQISRIQNQLLYQNFNFEQKKLFELRSNQLQPQEKERYLWHGCRTSNPKIIYEGIKEGLDSTYSQDTCSFGRGIYFAENASISQGYAYKLNQNDDFRYQGKQVFLLCLVCTGKTIQLNNSNSSLRRAPDGYDCVIGGGNQFILYGMDVRRAYPAFEVIFE